MGHSCGCGHCDHDEEKKEEATQPADEDSCGCGHSHNHTASISSEDRKKLEDKIANLGFKVEETADGEIKISE